MGKTLIILGNVWLWLAFGLNLLGYGFLYFQGWSALQETANPFNVWNFIAMAIIAAPGIGLIWLGERLIDRRSDAKL